MVKSPLVRVLLCLAVLALIGVTALALGTKQNFTTINNGRKVIAMKGPSVVTPRDVRSDAGLKTIAGNISTYPYGVFFCCFGNTISGGGSNFPYSILGSHSVHANSQCHCNPPRSFGWFIRRIRRGCIDSTPC